MKSEEIYLPKELIEDALLTEVIRNTFENQIIEAMRYALEKRIIEAIEKQVELSDPHPDHVVELGS